MANKDNELPIVVSVDTSDVTVKFAEIADDAPSLIEMEAVLNVDDSALDIVNDIPDETNTDVNITESEDAKQAVADIHFMALKDKIETVWNIVGTGVGILTDIGGKLINPFLDVEDAVAKINAQTGGTGVADLGQLIRDIQAADLGDSVDQISDVMIAAQHLNQPLEEAATAALTFTHTFKEEDPTIVLNTLDALVKQHLVPDLQSAADLMTVFFQAGGNKSGDALQTVDKYATAWSDMGLDIAEALSFVTSLMAGGVDTSEAASKMLLDFDNAMTVATDPTSAQAKFLAAHGLDNPKEMGEAIGAETINGFITAFQTMSVEDQDMASKMFFGKGGALNTGAIAGATSEDPRFKDYIDSAKRAATEIDNSLRGAIDDFVTQVNATIADLLSSEKIDLPGKIAALKEGFQEAVAVLSTGGTVGEALEVALNIPGLSKTLDTFIGNFERIIGNLEIAFLQVVASIQDITLHSKEAEATRKQIRGLAGGQMAFDIQLANADEIPTIVAQALGRGLSMPEVVTALETGVNESIAKGNYDQGAQIITGSIEGALADGASPEVANALAFDFTDKLKGGFDNALAAGNLPTLQDMIAIEPNATIPGLDEAVSGFKKQLSDAFAPQNRAGDQGNPFLTGLGAGIGKQGATSQGGLFGDVISGVEDFKDKTQAAADTAGIALTHVADVTKTTTDAVTSNWNDVDLNLDTTQQSIIDHVTGVATATEEADTRIAAATTGNTMTTSFTAVQTAAETSFPIVIEWFGRTAQGAQELDGVVTNAVGHMSKLLHDLQFLSAAVAQGVADAVAAGANLPSVVSGGGASGDTNINVSQTNNNSNGAQTAATTYQIAAAVGGSA